MKELTGADLAITESHELTRGTARYAAGTGRLCATASDCTTVRRKHIDKPKRITTCRVYCQVLGRRI